MCPPAQRSSLAPPAPLLQEDGCNSPREGDAISIPLPREATLGHLPLSQARGVKKKKATCAAVMFATRVLTPDSHPRLLCPDDFSCVRKYSDLNSVRAQVESKIYGAFLFVFPELDFTEGSQDTASNTWCHFSVRWRFSLNQHP